MPEQNSFQLQGDFPAVCLSIAVAVDTIKIIMFFCFAAALNFTVHCRSAHRQRRANV